MAIIDGQIYKLDIYNNRVGNALYKCADGESFCKAMIPKLVFYDRDEILKMHADSIMNRDVKYDVSTLQTIPVIDKSEKIEKVVPLECFWIAVFFADKKTKELIQDKVMYISSDGDGYLSDNIECALKGVIPDEICVDFIKRNPNGLVLLDRKFAENDYSESRKMLYDVARAEITKVFADILNNSEVKLEDLHNIISEGFRNKENHEVYEQARLLDFLYANTVAEKIIEFDKKYNEFHLSKQPSESE